jgi:SDR family mycofactocin-dependent oxidoreductase
VAFISGGARGQGRSHAVRLAQEGADIVTFDICEQFETVAYTGATEDDLAETVKQVESLDRRIVARKADVRDPEAVCAVFAEGITELGRVDIVVANAGIGAIVGAPARPLQAWYDCIDVMLSGVLHTVEAAVPTLISQGEGGSIVITSSTGGLKAPVRTLETKNNGMLGYIAAKHGVVGLMRAYANSLGPYGIRSNTIHPTGVNTPMVVNAEFGAYAEQNPSMVDAMHNTLPIPMIEPVDVSNAIVYLVSETGRYVNGVQLPVDAGCSIY